MYYVIWVCSFVSLLGFCRDSVVLVLVLLWSLLQPVSSSFLFLLLSPCLSICLSSVSPSCLSPVSLLPASPQQPELCWLQQWESAAVMSHWVNLPIASPAHYINPALSVTPCQTIECRFSNGLSSPTIPCIISRMQKPTWIRFWLPWIPACLPSCSQNSPSAGLSWKFSLHWSQSQSHLHHHTGCTPPLPTLSPLLTATISPNS